MPRPLPAAGCLRTSFTNTSNQQHVWISDALLNESLYNYVHRHRRYGSSVPGPLEARRRATKRKNTSLAYAGHGAAPVDATFLMGNTSASNWWQPPQDTRPEQSPSLLPAWLFRPSDQPPFPARSEQLAETERDASLKEAEQLKHEKEFHWIVGDKPTAKIVRETLRNLHIAQRTRPRLIEAAFRRLLDTVLKSADESVEPVVDFLSDPILNPTGTKNHLILFTKLCHRPTSEEAWDSALLPATLRAIQLGLVTAPSLREIVVLLPKLRQALGTRSDNSDLLIADWQRILDAITECKVLTIHDLGAKFLKKWYDSVAQAWPDTSAVATIKLLQGITTSSGRTDSDVAADLLVRRLTYANSKNSDVRSFVTGSIQLLPISIWAEAVLVATLKLIQISARDKDKGRLLQWSNILQGIDKKSLSEPFLDQHTWLCAYDVPLELSPMQKFVSLVWVATRLAKSRLELYQLVESSQIQKQFRNTQSNAEIVVEDDAMHQIEASLDSLPLPEKRQVYETLQHLTKHNLLSVMGDKAYEEEITALMERDFRKFDDEDFYRWAKTHQRDDLTRLAESANRNLPAFLRMSQAVYSKNRVSMKIIRRIFLHNTAFKIALSRWPEHLAEQRQKRKTAIAVQTRHDDHEVNPAEAIELIHRLAATIAVSPVLGARSAFRQVYFFYLMLHRHGAPIWSDMSRALWHAGVSRYGESAAPYAQMEWCLSQVRKIEGRDVALRLSQSSAYRREVRDEMEAFARQIHAVVRNEESWASLDGSRRTQSMQAVEDDNGDSDGLVSGLGLNAGEWSDVKASHLVVEGDDAWLDVVDSSDD